MDSYILNTKFKLILQIVLWKEIQLNKGGAIYFYNTNTLYLNNCNFISNYASSKGGAIRLYYKKYSLYW